MQDLMLWSLVILLIIWAVFGFLYLIIDEVVIFLQRRRERSQNKVRDHFRQTERFRNDIY